MLESDSYVQNCSNNLRWLSCQIDECSSSKYSDKFDIKMIKITLKERTYFPNKERTIV